ncbi:Plastocyanin-like protein [Corchorus olitorius]|uniref:Plastocyanin-like protein n=1 Tax=Corchorus olitorius TaxID=93759 RepID=A0A1R3KDA6_9ROSI|nr:Plastocyanin-like protein [Corchorus olitorius]
MASSKKTMTFLFVMLAMLGLSLGAVHKVGDSTGWTSMGNIDYAKWASTRTFHVGDSLHFEYNSQFHNVMQVTHPDFQSCKGTSAIASYTSGSDSVTLKRPGHFYFLCGVPGHCQAGQKVDILVVPSSIDPSQSPSPSAINSFAANPPSESAPAPGPAQSGALSLVSSSPKLLLALSLVAHVYVFGV